MYDGQETWLLTALALLSAVVKISKLLPVDSEAWRDRDREIGNMEKGERETSER